MPNKSTLAIAGFLIVVAVTFLIISSTGSTARYFLTVEELLAMGEAARERSITVSGAVLGESIDYDAQAPQVTFAIVQVPGDLQALEQAGGLEPALHAAVQDPLAPRLTVVYAGVQPDMLRHEAQAIVRGTLGEDDRFYADEVLLKCPSRYEEALPDQVGD